MRLSWVWCYLAIDKHMFKLLTDKTREKVEHEYIIRRVIVMLSGLILVSLIGVIGLLPSYVLSNARLNEVLERTRIINSLGRGDDEPDLRGWLLETNQKLKILSPKLDTDRPSDVIEKIVDQSLKGLRITGFLWTKVEGGVTLSVNGVAQDRQTLITFENRLNDSGHFSEVTLPISNLAKDKDIDFQIKFSPL